MTNNVSGVSDFKLQGNFKAKITTTPNSENGKNNIEFTKVSVFSGLDEDKSKHVSGEEMQKNNSSLFAQYNLNTDAAKEKAYNLAGLQSSAIKIANNKVQEMKDFGTELNNMLTKFKSSKLFEKLSPDKGKTSVSVDKITSTTGELDRQANTEFSNHANNVQDKLSKAMAKALAEIANEARIEGQKQDIANAAKSKDKSTVKHESKPQAEQPKNVKLDGKNNKNDTLKDGALTASKDNENVKKSKENQEVKDKDSKDDKQLTLASLKSELGETVELPIAGRPRGYKAQAWNNMINKHSELNGKQIKNMITEDNAKAALNRYLAAMEKN